MASSTRRALVLALALGASGCVTGHLLDAARRWERPTDVDAASLDGDRLALRYRARITDDDGAPLGERLRSIAVDVAALRSGRTTPLVTDLPDDGPLPGRPLPLSDGSAPPALAITRFDDDRPARLELHDGRDPSASLYTNALVRSSTAPWAYPLLPIAGAIDVVGVPVLLFFAPAMLVIGD